MGRQYTGRLVRSSTRRGTGCRRYQRSVICARPPELDPRVYSRLTDNWLELSLRFVARDHDVRALKDAMSRDILAALEASRIGIASGTYAVVEMPPLTVRTVPA